MGNKGSKLSSEQLAELAKSTKCIPSLPFLDNCIRIYCFSFPEGAPGLVQGLSQGRALGTPQTVGF